MSKICGLTVPKFFVGDIFSFSLTSGIENVRDKGGGNSRFSVENLLSQSGENFRRGTLLCCVAESF